MEEINCKTILTNEINDFCKYLMNNCNDESKKEFINEKIKDLSYYNILLFLNVIKITSLEKSANYIIKTYSVIDNDKNKKKIIEYLNYFLEVNKILNCI